MRSRLFLLLAPLSVAAFAANFAACASPPKLDDLCGWLGDANNCYRELAAEVRDQCGAFGTDQQATTGRFSKLAERTSLETCVFDKGGNVKFDPPLNTANFPLSSVSFVITNKDGTTCGAGSFGANGAFSIGIAPSPAIAEGATCTPSDAQLCGGTFSLATSAGKTFGVTCPSNTNFQFSFEQTAKCDETAASGGLEGEQKLDQLIPRAELVSNPGSVGIDGFVKFRVYYSLDVPENGSLSGKELSPVEYFNCIIPGAAATCGNGVKDDGEADVDCGIACQKGCANDKFCEFPPDCTSGYCAANNMGIFVCQPCTTNSQCATGQCTNSICVDPGASSGAGGGGGAGGGSGAGGAGGGP